MFVHSTDITPPLSFPSAVDREPSRPPSYRSRTSSAGGGILRSCVGGNASCSQDTLATTAATVHRSFNATVHGVNGGSLSSASTTSNRDTPSPPPLGGGLSSSSGRAPDPQLLRKNHDVNTVTIVQTTDTSQVINQDTVIVSVSGHNARTLVLPSGHSEVQVTLAHV
ncbi:hypothetical protein HPB48_000106 [Haemaphysalis longicornis]|uniref:Uncharacterized protein n=1 Tax=Haemaphysalis longicornis TaxID=44386 RepID=A0A9J6FR60_HAELO|nr:hypothetical protein HPB48_000106 [Haemaphysalis longicornis]